MKSTSPVSRLLPLLPLNVRRTTVGVLAASTLATAGCANRVDTVTVEPSRTLTPTSTPAPQPTGFDPNPYSSGSSPAPTDELSQKMAKDNGDQCWEIRRQVPDELLREGITDQTYVNDTVCGPPKDGLSSFLVKNGRFGEMGTANGTSAAVQIPTVNKAGKVIFKFFTPHPTWSKGSGVYQGNNHDFETDPVGEPSFGLVELDFTKGVAHVASYPTCIESVGDSNQSSPQPSGKNEQLAGSCIDALPFTGPDKGKNINETSGYLNRNFVGVVQRATNTDLRDRISGVHFKMFQVAVALRTSIDAGSPEEQWLPTLMATLNIAVAENGEVRIQTRRTDFGYMQVFQSVDGKSARLIKDIGGDNGDLLDRGSNVGAQLESQFGKRVASTPGVSPGEADHVTPVELGLLGTPKSTDNTSFDLH